MLNPCWQAAQVPVASESISSLPPLCGGPMDVAAPKHLQRLKKKSATCSIYHSNQSATCCIMPCEELKCFVQTVRWSKQEQPHLYTGLSWCIEREFQKCTCIYIYTLFIIIIRVIIITIIIVIIAIFYLFIFINNIIIIINMFIIILLYVYIRLYIYIYITIHIYIYTYCVCTRLCVPKK